MITDVNVTKLAEAIQELAVLRADNARLREALVEAAGALGCAPCLCISPETCVTCAAILEARAALDDTQKGKAG